MARRAAPSPPRLPRAAAALVVALALGALAAFHFGSPRPAAHPAAPLGTPADGAPPLASHADCHAGSLVTVVAHLDDDLLFVNPGIAHRLAAGWCIVTVHLIGGANGASFDYVLTRERAIRGAYARMANAPDRWREATVTLAGSPVHWMTLQAQPRVQLVELRLPGGRVRGGSVPLGRLWDEAQTIATYPIRADGGSARYDRAALVATVGALLSRATLIYTLNPDAVPFAEHPDHIYAARIVRFAAQALHVLAPLRYHLTYVTGTLPVNVASDDIQAKRDAAASYFAVDAGVGDLARVFGEDEWNGDWIARRYVFDDERPSRPASDALAAPSPTVFNLVNAYTLQCVDASGRGGPLRLGACGAQPTQRWRWLSVPSHPGNEHDAALVNQSTGQCTAERGDALIGVACDPDDIDQRFTPWDFGMVRTPRGRCLGERDGALAIAPCDAQTSAFRWAPALYSRWTDLRLAGAMIDDVAGPGKPAAVYVARRTDGPGFDVWVAPLRAQAHARRWYANAVPFDARATRPTCDSATLCFDNTRFLLGDFDGDGRADLLAIGPRNGGTGFWLLRNLGDRFDAPRLWYQSTAEFSSERTQQYVAADFTGDGRADVMLAQTPVASGQPAAGDASAQGLELWVLASLGASSAAPARWLAASGARTASADAAPHAYAPTGSTQFLAARVDDSARAGLFALDDAAGVLAVTPIASTGHGFVPAEPVRCTTCRKPFTKVAAGPLGPGRGVDGLVMLTLREPTRADPATIDVWTMAGGAHLQAPVHAGAAGSVAWADALPALAPRHVDASATPEPSLVLFSRVNMPLDEYRFTSGAPQLIAYPLLDAGHALGPAQPWGPLPGRYGEALRVDRLN
ncbi:FG-GAP-like repeat-containing protein [Trinickia sp.]|uniref:FG-GAP-like repeat-containing protein n=1 Tax=Trinickia sp. TaxID=2571163 RepID=UPI003F818642